MERTVKAEIISQTIPTYQMGKPEVNPVFFEKRVYQGSSGKVYPVPFIDKVYDKKVDLNYKTAILENDFVRLVMLPEIGGRIFEAQDKSNGNYDFFYKQEVIKPALVGLAGPWISGGVEFNWPQHHRPGTYMPTDVFIEEEEDGARTIWMSEYDPLNRMKGMHGIRLRPDSALIELRARLFNRTPFIQTFLWWANVAVRVHDNYESFFPADVHYVADHAVRAQSSFPFARNDYYGIPYHKRKGANDLRRYSNIPVPTSYMVCETGYDFFGGYDHDAKGGFIHVANRHIAPGKKQWTWGNAEFGKAWDRELTDKGGPYFELMAGVYTDNQPDFTYLVPYETKTFSQYWWGYKNLGPVQNANKDFAIRLEILQGNKLDIGVAATRESRNLKIIVKTGDELMEFKNVHISPSNPWQENTLTFKSGQENHLEVCIENRDGVELLSYRHKEPSKVRNRITAFEPKEAKDVEYTSELNLIGEHLEQYRHPTRDPENYWKEALIRNPNDFNAHISLGKQKLKSGLLQDAESHFLKAIKILTSYHPNPKTGEAHYFAGISCFYQNKQKEAYSLLYKATWNYEWRSSAYFFLANIDCRNKDFEMALEHLEASLDTNRQNNKAYVLKAILLRKLNQLNKAHNVLRSLFKTDPLDQWANYELAKINNDSSFFLQSSRNDAQTILDIVFDYTDAGLYEDALQLIELHHKNQVEGSVVPNPLKQTTITSYTLAWLYHQIGVSEKSLMVLEEASKQCPDYFFPSRIHEQIILKWAVEQNIDPSLAAYGLGNFLMDKKRHADAIYYWELAATNSMPYGTLYRNLGIVYWNHLHDKQKSREAFEKAIQLAPDDVRILFEFDQLRKKMNDSPSERLAFIKSHGDKVFQRDDFSVELAALYNFTGQYEKALDMMTRKKFHPWEGGEGQVIRQYTQTCLKLGQRELENNNAKEALEYFRIAENTPDNLGEKYHPLQAKAHIRFWQGKALAALGRKEESISHFEKSANEQGDFIDMAVSTFSEMTFYSALSFMELGKDDEAKNLLRQMKCYAEAKLNEEMKIDYFATSLPLLLVFDEDLQNRNEWENKHLLALAESELGNKEKACDLLKQVLRKNAMHVGALGLLQKLELSC